MTDNIYARVTDYDGRAVRYERYADRLEAMAAEVRSWHDGTASDIQMLPVALGDQFSTMRTKMGAVAGKLRERAAAERRAAAREAS